MKTLHRFAVAAGALAALAASFPAFTLDFPTRPVRLIVPFVAGGSSDIVARIIGQQLGDKWGQQIVVDNRPGGGTIIGTAIAARANPDGYTLVTANVAFAINEALGRKIPYHALRDFSPVILIARQPSVIAALPSFPASNVKELVALAKAKPDSITFGSSGVGTIGHLAGELLKQMTGIRMTHVPYKGGGELVTQLLGNQVSLGIMGLPPAMPHIKAGRLKVIAVTDGKRAVALPQVPTVSETVPGFEVSNWIGILAPAKTPAALVQKIYADVSAILRIPSVEKSLSNQGFEIWNGSPQVYRNLIASDIRKYRAVVKHAGIKVE